MKFFQNLKILILTTLMACNSSGHFEAIYQFPDSATRGDLIVVSGGTVASNVTPYPLHKVALFDSTGTFKRFLYEGKSAELLYGGAIDPVTKDFFYSVENVDRIEKIDLSSFESSLGLIDPNLNGTLRALAILDDGSFLAAESPTVIEKFSSSGVRAGAPFPLTIPTAINNIKAISGNRFVVTFTTNPDSPRIYDATGTLVATFPTTAPCGVNCDPFDVVELPDGRFVLNSRVTHGLYLYDVNLTYVGVFYLDTTVINMPSAMAMLDEDTLIVCGTSFNTCETLTVSGNTATRERTSALINDVSAVRQPLSITVVP